MTVGRRTSSVRLRSSQKIRYIFVLCLVFRSDDSHFRRGKSLMTGTDKLIRKEGNARRVREEQQLENWPVRMTKGEWTSSLSHACLRVQVKPKPLYVYNMYSTIYSCLPAGTKSPLYRQNKKIKKKSCTNAVATTMFSLHSIPSVF